MFFEKMKSVESYKMFLNKKKGKHTFFAVIETKPVDIVFNEMINKIKQMNRKYITTQ